MPTISEELPRLQQPPLEDSEAFKQSGQGLVLYHQMGLSSCGPAALKHQKVSIVECLKYSSYMLLLDKGMGKSKILLDVFRERKKQHHDAFKGLILCPNQTNVKTWSGQIQEHAPTLKALLCPSQPDDKRAWLQATLEGEFKDWDLMVMDYYSLQTLLTVKPERTQGKTVVMFPLYELITEFRKLFQMVVFDECHNIKERDTLRFNVLKSLVKIIPYRYGATATLFNQSPEEAWPQFYLLDGGETFGSNIGSFRLIYCKKKVDHFAYSGFVWVWDPKKTAQFQKRLRGSSIHYQISDLPSLRFVKPELTLTQEQKIVYNRVLKDAQKARKAKQHVVVNIFQDLRRVMSGFYPGSGEDEKPKTLVSMAHSPKLEWLTTRSWLKEPLVIFYDFTATGEQVVNALVDEGVKVGWLYSGCKDKGEVLSQWDKEEISCLVIQNTVGSTGLNLQRSHRAVFYECPLSALVRSQAQGRIHRLGQTRVAYIYDLFFEGSVEEKILNRVNLGISLHKAVVEAVVN